jgi:radical SAM superfamily enzyme
MSKLTLLIDIALIAVLFTAGIWAVSVVSLFVADTVIVPWHSYALAVATTALYVSLVYGAISMMQTSVIMHRIVNRRIRVDGYAASDRAQSAMRDYKSEVRAWQSAANSRWDK